MSDELSHIGVKRRSGRYPWGSGKNPYQSGGDFMSAYRKLKASGLSEKDIALGLGCANTSELRAKRAIANHDERLDLVDKAQALKDKGWSNAAIAKEIGVANESSVRSLLNPETQRRQDVLMNIADQIRMRIDKDEFIDIGSGAASELGVSEDKFKAALYILKQEGYEIGHTFQIPVGGHMRTYKVAAPPGTTYAEIRANQSKLKTISDVYTDDMGATFKSTAFTPKSVDSKRVQIVYGDKGGADKDGLIELRRGVEDISLGDSRYAQVRIAVDDTHFIKGMAVYSDDLPKGVDIRFNTNKPSGTPMKGTKDNSVLKNLKDDPDSPFKSVTRPPREYRDKDGKLQKSVINKVNEEGDWKDWGIRFSAQMLSKQNAHLVKTQLELTQAKKKADYEEIMSLTNPVVKKKMLEKFADGCDSAAVHLKAAAMPRSQNHVILPVPGMRPNEVYAPNYKHGDNVVLIRYPHGGIFEIPELTVTNRSTAAKKIIPNDAPDAIGIHPSVAKKLSGADFDGDTVLVIPNRNGAIKTAPVLKELKNFDPQQYKLPDGVKGITDRRKQAEMGKVSNLITDMTIKGAPLSEIARAVKHSMVVIDAEKHRLDISRSERDNNILELKKKYQYEEKDGKTSTGASTIVSRSNAKVQGLPEVKLRTYKDHGAGPIDPKTGKKVLVETGREYVDKKTGKKVLATQTRRRGELVDDAYDLVSSQRRPVELLYASHSNKLRAMANEARKEYLAQPNMKLSPAAKKAYASEVSSLNKRLEDAKKLRPKERQAQLIADTVIKQKMAANPNLDRDDLKKLRHKELVKARTRIGLNPQPFRIEPREWEAIQSGAVSTHVLSQIMAISDPEHIQSLAMPKPKSVVTPAKRVRAKAMLAAGYTQAEVAEAIGVSINTMLDSVRG